MLQSLPLQGQLRDFDKCFEATAAEFLVEMSTKSSAFYDNEEPYHRKNGGV